MATLYTIMVESRFSAVHSVRLPNGRLEAKHGHDWLVRAQFARTELDADGMVISFDEAQSALASVTKDFQPADLNAYEGLAGRNPTAEVIARYIFERLTNRGYSTVCRVEVREAPGCAATYERSPLPADA